MFGNGKMWAEIETLKAKVESLQNENAKLRETLEDFRQTLGEMAGNDLKPKAAPKGMYGPEHEFVFNETR